VAKKNYVLTVVFKKTVKT